MPKGICIAAVLLLLLGITPSGFAQSVPVISRTALSRMNVLSRAALFEDAIAEAARNERVDPKILWAIAYNETRFRPWLVSPKRARGLMQFIPTTAARFGLADPYEPRSSIYAAARYVKYLGELFDGRLDSILAAYNSGEGTVAAFLEGKTIRSNARLINPLGRRTKGGVPPYAETINYVSQGVKVYRWLEAQGRFRDASARAVIYAANQSKPREKEISQEGDNRKLTTTTVLYEPRTGRRFLVGGSRNGKNGVQPIDLNGPVIISPDLRSFPSQKARSTFAGMSRR